MYDLARIAAELTKLRDVALKNELGMLAYLIDMAIAEAASGEVAPPHSPLHNWMRQFDVETR